MRYGSLFSGYGGLDIALQSVLGGDTAWHVEFDKAPSRILAHHWPDVPNLGDITTVDWSQVEPVDVITGGSPCQDLSHAGKRAGMTEGTRSNLWVQMREAIATLRPRLVVWENVQGALSAAAESALIPDHFDNAIRYHLTVASSTRSTDVRALHNRAANRLMEHRSRRVGDGRPGPVLRALGRVVGDLSELGYDTWWTSLRAADVGAAHVRFRVFLFAWPADSEGDTWRLLHGDCHPARHAEGHDVGHDGIARSSLARRDEGAAGEPDSVPGQLVLLLTPDAYSADRGGTQHPDKRRAGGHQPTIADVAEHLLPTPRATDGTKGGPNQRGSSGDLMLPSAVNLLPTPSVADVEGGRKHRSGDRADELLLNGIAHHDRWGDYAPAIARWESVLGRPAPAPTEPSEQSRKRCAVHGDPEEGRPREGLPHVRKAADAQEVHEWPTGGQGRVPQEDALLPVVREHEGSSGQGHAPLEGEEAQGEVLQGVRGADRLARASHRQEPGKQRPVESGDLVRELPSETALAGGPREAPGGEPCSCKPRLSPKFCEFLMGLPAGHVTAPAIGLTRNEQLKALGNGVVPAQAAAATRAFIADLAQIDPDRTKESDR